MVKSNGPRGAVAVWSWVIVGIAVALFVAFVVVAGVLN
jgi:hypothetical protein